MQSITGSGDWSTRVPAPLRGLVAVCWQAIRHFFMEDGFVVAGYVAYTAIFAIFPFLIFLLSLAAFVGEGPAASETITLALDLVPEEVRGVLEPAIEDIRRGSTPGLITFSIVLSLWFASSGLESIRHALNIAYNVSERRSFILLRLQSLLLTIIAAIVILAVMLFIIAAPYIQVVLEWLAQRQLFDHQLYLASRYAIGLTLLLGLTVGLHLALPGTRLRLMQVLPGCVVAVLIWAVAASAYSLYLANFATYSVTYGSLGGVVATLLFFYLSAGIFIFGAQINGALRRRERGRRARTAS